MKIHRLSPLALILASSVPFQPSKVYADCGGTWFPGLCEFGKKVMPQSVQDAGAEFDRGVIQPVADAIKEGADSAARLCRKVGVTTCMNPNFLNTYATVKLSANAGLIKDADSCGAMVQSAISGGSKAVQIYAAANGVPVPNEVMALGASMFQSYGIVSCEVVYGRAPNLSGYTQTADGAVVTPEALPRVTGQIVAGPSSTASGTGNSTEAQLGLLREQQKIEQEKRERQAKEDQDRRAQEERDRRAREESERRMQEIKQRSDMNATLINAGANVLGALISRLGRGTPTQPAETPAPTQSVASQQISKETLDNPLERLHGCGKTQSWQAAAVSRDRFSRGSLTPNLPVTRHSLVTFNSLAIPKHMSRLLLLFKLP